MSNLGVDALVKYLSKGVPDAFLIISASAIDVNEESPTTLTLGHIGAIFILPILATALDVTHKVRSMRL